MTYGKKKIWLDRKQNHRCITRNGGNPIYIRNSRPDQRSLTTLIVEFDKIENRKKKK